MTPITLGEAARNLILEQDEECIPLAVLAKEITARSGKRGLHTSILYRWTGRGLKGVRLEFVQRGGTRATSREALARFFAALTARVEGRETEAVVRTPAARRRAIERAERELNEMGIH